MTSPSDISTLQQRLNECRAAARALLGAPESSMPLIHIRAEITAYKAQLRAANAVVEDQPEDGELATKSPLSNAIITSVQSGGINFGIGTTIGTLTLSSADTTTQAARPTHQLRAPVADFIGRDDALTTLTDALRLRQSHPVAVISGVRGMGGIGKTELAYAVAARLQSDYPDGQILLELRSTSSVPLSVAQALLEVIRAFFPEEKLPEDLPSLQRLYRTALTGKRVLILADDARDAAQIRPLLPPAGSALLITSRQRFTLDGMTVVDLERLTPDASVALLRSICPGLTDDQAARIAVLCGYLPLALRISGGILQNDPALTPERYLAQLAEQRLVSLRDPDDPALDVEAILLLSYTALDPATQQSFRRLGVLAADAPLPIVAELLRLPKEETDTLMRGLLRRSLVEFDAAHNRWGMHDLVRECARGLLARAGEEREARLWYAELVIRVVNHFDTQYSRGRDVLSALAAFDRERPHLEAVRIWLWSQPAEAIVNALILDEIKAMMNIGDLRDPVQEKRIPQLNRGLIIARQQGDRINEGSILSNLGIAYWKTGSVNDAITYYKHSLSITKESGDRYGESVLSSNLGIAYDSINETEQAISYYEKALDIAEKRIASRIKRVDIV